MKTGMLTSFYNKVLPTLYNSQPMQKAIKWGSTQTTINGQARTNFSRLTKHLPGIFGIWITGFYLLCMAKSKDIPKERKRPLILNNLLIGLFGITGGYVASGAIHKFTKALEPRFEKIVKNHPKKEILLGGLRAVAPLIGFTFVFRYICPVLGTPAANSLNKFLIRHKVLSDPDKKTKPEN
jgi:hypothetical protein